MHLAIGLAGYLFIGSAIGGLAIPGAGVDVAGVVHDGRGRPMLDVKVSLMRVDDLPAEKPGDPPRKTLVEMESLRTGADGTFKFAGVSNGHYQLLLARGTNWLIAEGLEIDSKPVGPFVIVMDGKTRVVSIRSTSRSAFPPTVC